MGDTGPLSIDNIVAGLFITILGGILTAIFLAYIFPSLRSAGTAGIPNASGPPHPGHMALFFGLFIGALYAFLWIRSGTKPTPPNDQIPTALPVAGTISAIPSTIQPTQEILILPDP